MLWLALFHDPDSLLRALARSDESKAIVFSFYSPDVCSRGIADGQSGDLAGVVESNGYVDFFAGFYNGSALLAT